TSRTISSTGKEVPPVLGSDVPLTELEHILHHHLLVVKQYTLW
ncbi:unnamed protein product, partial [Choristocarpus tenellus]